MQVEKEHKLNLKKAKIMNKQSQKIMRVVEYINTNDLLNTQWQVMTSTTNAASYYGATNENKNLKPHIAVWVDYEDVEEWARVADWDETLFTKEGDIIAIFYF